MRRLLLALISNGDTDPCMGKSDLFPKKTANVLERQLVVVFRLLLLMGIASLFAGDSNVTPTLQDLPSSLCSVRLQTNFHDTM